MKHWLIAMFLYSYVSVLSFSQMNVSVDSDCLKRNSALISKVMIETFGKDSISFLLDNNIKIMFVSQVDSLGAVLKLDIVRSNWIITNDFITLIETYLIESRIQFYICYTQDPPNVPKSHIIASAREYFKNNDWKTINLGFPGELMDLYEYNRKKAKEKGVYLSKYDYLLMQINKF